MPDKKLTDELLNELLDAPSIDGYIKEHDFAAPSLSDYLKQLLQEKGLERSRVVRMADLNETFGYQIFTGSRNPSRNKVLQDCLCNGAVDERDQLRPDGCRSERPQLQGPSRCNHYLLHRPWL